MEQSHAAIIVALIAALTIVFLYKGQQVDPRFPGSPYSNHPNQQPYQQPPNYQHAENQYGNVAPSKPKPEKPETAQWEPLHYLLIAIVPLLIASAFFWNRMQQHQMCQDKIRMEVETEKKVAAVRDEHYHTKHAQLAQELEAERQDKKELANRLEAANKRAHEQTVENEVVKAQIANQLTILDKNQTRLSTALTDTQDRFQQHRDDFIKATTRYDQQIEYQGEINQKTDKMIEFGMAKIERLTIDQEKDRSRFLDFEQRQIGFNQGISQQMTEGFDRLDRRIEANKNDPLTAILGTVIGQIANPSAGLGRIANPAAVLGQIVNPAAGLGRIANPASGLGRIANPASGLGRIANPAAGLGLKATKDILDKK